MKARVSVETPCIRSLTPRRGRRERGDPSGYHYDAEGNLIQKAEPDGRIWTYAWNGAGMLASVTRPDATVVTFHYDALGRRIKKTYRGQTTHWVWDGNNPLHEWVEGKLKSGRDPSEPSFLWSADPLIKKRDAELEAHLAQGPPARGSKEAPITWLFEPESFSPMAKLIGGASFSIVTDHLGTPVLMADASGEKVWSAGISAYGELRDVEGERFACPFRWPGQYEAEPIRADPPVVRGELRSRESEDPLECESRFSFPSLFRGSSRTVELASRAARCFAGTPNIATHARVPPRASPRDARLRGRSVFSRVDRRHDDGWRCAAFPFCGRAR